MPAYAICTDQQMAEMAKPATATLATLQTVAGFGEGKAARYGARLLAALSEQGNDEAGQAPVRADQ